VVEHESLFITCQTAKASARMIHTVVSNGLISGDLRINKAHHSNKKVIKDGLTTTE
jgi:hypothetical protein